MAWRAVLPLMDGAMASAVAVATHPTPMEHRQGSPPTRRPKASMGEGGLTVGATIDGGPCAVGGRNEGCHGAARRAPADGRR